MDYLTLLVFKWLWFKLFTINFKDYLIFSHGQLNVALSWGVSQNSTKVNSTKVVIKEGKIKGEDEDFTKNVVFKDIFSFFYCNHSNVSFT